MALEEEIIRKEIQLSQNKEVKSLNNKSSKQVGKLHI